MSGANGSDGPTGTLDSLGGSDDDLPGLDPQYDSLRLLLIQASDDEPSMPKTELHRGENENHGSASVDPYQSCSPSHQKPVSSPAKITEHVP